MKISQKPSTLSARFPSSVVRPNALKLACALLALGSAMSVTACGPQYDPITREEVWHPDHSNRANLTMQVANPSDLVRGTGTTTSDGMLASAAVDRLRNDKIKKLPAADISQLSVTQAGANNSAGGQ